MHRKPLVGVLGFSDGEPEVHEQLKGIVQAQVDTLVSALRATGEVDVIVGDQLVDTGKRMALPGHPAAMRGRAR